MDRIRKLGLRLVGEITEESFPHFTVANIEILSDKPRIVRGLVAGWSIRVAGTKKGQPRFFSGQLLVNAAELTACLMLDGKEVAKVDLVV